MEQSSRSISRRSFITLSAVLGSGLLAGVQIERKSKYRTAIIGLGGFGTQFLLSAIDSGRATIVACCDVNRRRLKDSTAIAATRDSAQTPNCYTSYAEMLGCEAIDLTIVATPDHWHVRHAIASLEARAHVLLADPICRTLGE